MSTAKSTTWVFDRLPPSGARRGGDPASHAFEHTLGTLVREVIQNANDQALAGQDPELAFRFIMLEGKALADFRAAVDWRALSPHLEAVAAQRNHQRFAERLAATKDRLLLLVIEDRYTVGLTGAEAGDNSHFAALCKDILFSFKSGEKAGGSYGLGKSVLWTFSGYGTVLFSSNLSAPEPRDDSPRLIGRVELPSHQVGDQGYIGPGWLGARMDSADGVRADSVWGKRAKALAKRLGMGRASTSGTSIGIVDFHSPVDDRSDDPTELVAEMKKSASLNFWPAAFAANRLTIGFEYQGAPEILSLNDTPELKPFVACQSEYQDHQELALAEPGDIVTRDIPIVLPPRKDKVHGQVTARVRLTVRLAEPNAKDHLYTTAMYRGAGMVVHYRKHRAVTLGARPFHAVLAAGMARDPAAPEESDRWVEAFLRAAEPPGHDEWRTTKNLKNQYKNGYAKALDGMLRATDAALLDLVREPIQQGQVGPDLLRKRFPLGTGKASGTTKGSSAFHFRNLHAVFDGERWDFQGEIRPNTPGESWQARISLKELGDDGTALGPMPIETVTLMTDEATCTWTAETVTIDAPTGPAAVCFEGASAPLSAGLDFVGALGLEVKGRVWKEKAK